jgi:hypothetical protein
VGDDSLRAGRVTLGPSRQTGKQLTGYQTEGNQEFGHRDKAQVAARGSSRSGQTWG